MVSLLHVFNFVFYRGSPPAILLLDFFFPVFCGFSRSKFLAVKFTYSYFYFSFSYYFSGLVLTTVYTFVQCSLLCIYSLLTF